MRYKKVHIYAHNFSISFFSSSETQQSTTLMDAKEGALTRLLFVLSGSSVFYNHHAT